MKKDVAIRENHDLYFKKEIIEMNVLYILDSIFLVFCALGFITSAWKNRDNKYNVAGNAIASLFMSLSVFLIWR